MSQKLQLKIKLKLYICIYLHKYIHTECHKGIKMFKYFEKYPLERKAIKYLHNVF